MKKIEFIGMVGILILIFGTSVQANLWSSQHNFTPKFREKKFIGSRLIQQSDMQTAFDRAFVFQNATIESFTPTGNVNEYVTLYWAKPLVFKRDFHLDSKFKIISVSSPLPEPPSPEPPSPLPTLPDT